MTVHPQRRTSRAEAIGRVFAACLAVALISTAFWVESHDTVFAKTGTPVTSVRTIEDHLSDAKEDALQDRALRQQSVPTQTPAPVRD